MTSQWTNILPNNCEIDGKGYLSHSGSIANQDTYTPLTHMTVVNVTGTDAKSFLQNQFSNDINLIEVNKGQLSSYSSPKGMLYSNFYVAQCETGYLLLIPNDIVTPVLRRLSMFVLRDDVQFTPSENHIAIGLVATTKDIASKLNHVINVECVSNDENSRSIIFTTLENAANTINTLNSLNLSLGNTSHWLEHQIQAGEAFISAPTYEQFVGQMLNLDLINGINFKKGCYPGQEYIARTQYRGQVRSRLYIIESSCDDLQAGDTLSISEKIEADPIGMVINANNHYATAVIRTKHVDKNEVVLTKLPNEKLHISSPQYVIEDKKEE